MKERKQPKKPVVQRPIHSVGDQPDDPQDTLEETSGGYLGQGYFPQQEKPVDKPVNKPAARKWLYYPALFLLLSVFIFAAYQITVYFVQSHKAKQEEEMIRTIIAETNDEATTTDTGTDITDPADADALASLAVQNTQDTGAGSKMPPVLTEFSRALAINADTVGKLQFGESTSAYVVQRDNSYYLRRSFSDEYSISGAIFLDVSCSIYPRSHILIIHGHNMRDGTAFGKLTRFDAIEYYNKYPVIHFSTLYESGQYQPFAAVYYSVDPQDRDYLDLYRVNALPDGAFPAFIQEVQSRSVYRIPIIVNKDEHVIVLTTCATDDPDMRFAVFAVEKGMV